ncbi:uncharacterized protein [Medicago truncatula]|uniref:uncharacterized protein n=1 Tax=Medicago truncatula TaxID=3880 RepID=UPI0019686954|nr:uncharacterized protein LOC25501606 [Medicago truncatula]
MTFLAERKDRGSVILILTHAQCKLADNGKPNLCNNWSGSKLLINLKHPVVEAFRASLQAQGHRFDQSLCQVSSSSQRVNYDEFSNLSGVKSIAEFRDFDKDTYCITVAKSLKFNPNRYGWYYETCTKCTKASRSGGASYKCSCGEEVEVPLTRYKVVVIMEYRDHKAEFLFWDKECFQILGVAADTLRKTMQQVGEDDPHIYPEVLDKLLKIEFALRVKYQLYYHQASVNAFSRDEIVIKNIKARLHPDEIRPEVQKVNESIVRNNTTLPSDPEKISGPGECSRVIPLPQTVKVENIVSSAECLNSDPTITVGSCGVANCLSAGKCKCHPAKRMKKE